MDRTDIEMSIADRLLDAAELADMEQNYWFRQLEHVSDVMTPEEVQECASRLNIDTTGMHPETVASSMADALLELADVYDVEQLYWDMQWENAKSMDDAELMETARRLNIDVEAQV